MNSLRRGIALNIAHRAGCGEAPGNTVVACRKALGNKADVLDIDIRHTQDGSFIACHDARLDRFTDARGYVQDLPYRKIRTKDARSEEHTSELQSH